MEVKTTPYKRCDVVKVTGRIDSATAPELAAAFDAINEAGRYKIVFDMSDVDFISSAALRVMVNTQKTCKRYKRGELVLAGVPKRIYETLDLVGFVILFHFFEDVTAAVGNF
jgi:anti-sigma B factor antagonist